MYKRQSEVLSELVKVITGRVLVRCVRLVSMSSLLWLFVVFIAHLPFLVCVVTQVLLLLMLAENCRARKCMLMTTH